MSEKHLQAKIAELEAQIQQANDMLTFVSNQRNAAQNECVQLAAQVAQRDREIAALKPVVQPDADAPKTE